MPSQSEQTLNQLVEGVLKPSGWWRSCDEGRPVDADGNPLPWITYGAQSMLAQLANPGFRVFEYGAGWSSLWWAARVKEVVTVDHHEDWVRQVHERKPPNLTVLHRGRGAAGTLPATMDVAFRRIAAEQPLSGNDQHNVAHGLNCLDFTGYAAALFDWPQHYFDVIVVDGMARAPCCYLAGAWVKPHGIVVVDNSDRWHYSAGLNALRDQGFGRIDFSGLSPALGYQTCTSIFVRSLAPLLAVPPRERRKVDIDYAQDHSVNELKLTSVEAPILL
jgi:hypothetical protein